ncbi:hypothetical protein FA15DRAFT_609258 [Coprinopsis marcescibilis]|uniref:Vacuolar import and degradation protein n=1 Tax=Coprinopsis marcescibilis TaxID=230819 RepID=A0A5C3LBJ5_COPMA|nr:hypothetical protein FA15DRAFT_609258 [Coprinopsis marcescibilis]
MPSGAAVPVVQDVQLDVQQPQQKFCSLCHTALSDPAAPVVHALPLAAALVCAPCRDHIRATRQHISSTTQRPYRLALDLPTNNVYQQPRSPHEAHSSTRRHQDTTQSPSSPHHPEPPLLATTSTPSCATAQRLPSLAPATSKPQQPPVLPPLAIGAVPCNGSSTVPSATVKAHTPTTASSTYYHPAPASPPRRPTALGHSAFDPLVDITRLRVRSQSHRCLYPGASFEGTQKSGRNSYDVNVRIVDVDFANSTLCGYLQIQGLTDDWPQLTTYFDAEIIGPRYGFLTQNWGASEREDMVHWARFPAFKNARQEAKRPHLTIDDRDRGAVFMRWKERFLVPDHLVYDINGASFAGFYYVCVDFNSQSGGVTEEDETETSTSIDDNQEARRRRASSAAGRRSKSRPRLAPLPPPVATMSGFYYHQNSEPYQQLSLTHMPESTSSSFEFR